MNRDRLISSLKTLEHFTNDSLNLKHHSNNLSGFHYNRDLLKAAVARYRKRVKKPIISRSRIEKLVDIGTKMILSGTLNQNPYTEEMMGIAYSSRGK